MQGRLRASMAGAAPPALPIGADAADMTRRARMETSLPEAHAAGRLPGLHSVLVLRGEETFAEAHFTGEDEAWGEALGEVAHGPDTLHDLRSVTKSIVGLLYGAALDRGLVPPPETPLFDALPGHDDLATRDKRAMTVGHALDMTLGLEWDESLPYSDPRNSEIAMVMEKDPVRFILSRPLLHRPGEGWTYSGGATTLLAALIARGAGKPLEAFAEEALFAPLGISRWEWRGLEGRKVAAASGLRLRARDLARIGRMMVMGGMWEGRRVVPADWLEQIFSPRADTGGELAYSRQWYMPPADPPPFVMGLGNGGQRFSVNPGAALVLVVFAGRYNDFDAWRLGVEVSVAHLAPALALTN